MNTSCERNLSVWKTRTTAAPDACCPLTVSPRFASGVIPGTMEAIHFDAWLCLRPRVCCSAEECVMNLRTFSGFVLPISLALAMSLPSVSHGNPTTGQPTNLHRRFVVQQTKRKAAQGRPTRRNVGVWLSGGYERTVSGARRSGYRTRRFRRW